MEEMMDLDITKNFESKVPKNFDKKPS